MYYDVEKIFVDADSNIRDCRDRTLLAKVEEGFGDSIFARKLVERFNQGGSIDGEKVNFVSVTNTHPYICHRCLAKINNA